MQGENEFQTTGVTGAVGSPKARPDSGDPEGCVQVEGERPTWALSDSLRPSTLLDKEVASDSNLWA